MNGWIGIVYVCMDRWIVRVYVCKFTYVWIEYMRRWMDGWMDGVDVGWMDESMNLVLDDWLICSIYSLWGYIYVDSYINR